MLNVIPAVLFLMSVCATPLQQAGIEAQALVPKGMPIKLKITYDETEGSTTSLTIKRIVPNDAKGAMFLVAMIGVDGKVVPGQGSLLRIPSYHLTDPMTVATANPNVARILIVVEWLEVESGKWVIDNSQQVIPHNAVIESGEVALPKAVFIPHRGKP